MGVDDEDGLTLQVRVLFRHAKVAGTPARGGLKGAGRFLAGPGNSPAKISYLNTTASENPGINYSILKKSFGLPSHQYSRTSQPAVVGYRVYSRQTYG